MAVDKKIKVLLDKLKKLGVEEVAAGATVEELQELLEVTKKKKKEEKEANVDEGSGAEIVKESAPSTPKDLKFKTIEVATDDEVKKLDKEGKLAGWDPKTRLAKIKE